MHILVGTRKKLTSSIDNEVVGLASNNDGSEVAHISVDSSAGGSIDSLLDTVVLLNTGVTALDKLLGRLGVVDEGEGKSSRPLDGSGRDGGGGSQEERGDVDHDGQTSEKMEELVV